ncbi:hypothetical protein [Moritella yayanosii]|uniref:SSU ribosomal protein S2p (SAe) n=1 Tax=Moritella yayanosii TaxID=69539 RepID=A0A330LPG3_9GAMM|nr:hypothetical protein [Moritella yayanosii]SQD78096.1 conserved protein of unknown function [Moritella yayanosii]
MDALPNARNKAVHIVEKQMPVDQLIMIMYNSPSEDTYKHFKMVNAHIKNGMVQVGQVVLLSPEGSEECTIEESEFLNIAKAVDLTLLKLSNSEKQLLVNRYEFLSNVASYNGLLLGVSNTAWNAHTNQVKSILKDLERAYVTSYQSSGNLHNKNFFAQRKIQFARLDAALSRFTQPAFGGKLVSGDIRGNLGLSSKSMIHQWSKQAANATTIPTFHKNYAVVAEMSRNLKRVGYVGIALTGFDAVMNIQKACTVNDTAVCSKAKYAQTGKAVVSIAGGTVGGAIAAWATCSLIFGLPSGGSSFFWCSVVAGGAGGYAGGSYGGEYGKSKGEELYKLTGVR